MSRTLAIRTLDLARLQRRTTVEEDKMKRVLAFASAFVVLGLTGTVSAAASTSSAAPCTLGALNMVHDATMFAIPMARNADQGTDGMFRAVAVSGCS